MRLEHLIADINEEMFRKITENHEVDEAEARETAKLVGLSAIKYGDLSNQASKDYVFDLDKFTSFEGNTGPYILYTIVRIKSILAKYAEKVSSMPEALTILPPENQIEKDLMLQLSRFADNLQLAYRDTQPNIVCSYIYDLSVAVNRFYHETRILSEPDETKQRGYVALITLVKRVLETCIDLLGFEAPEKM